MLKCSCLLLPPNPSTSALRFSGSSYSAALRKRRSWTWIFFAVVNAPWRCFILGFKHLLLACLIACISTTQLQQMQDEKQTSETRDEQDERLYETQKPARWQTCRKLRMQHPSQNSLMSNATAEETAEEGAGQGTELGRE